LCHLFRLPAERLGLVAEEVESPATGTLPAVGRDLESLSFMLDGLHPFDGPGLDDLVGVLRDLQRQCDADRPYDLLRRVRWHIASARAARAPGSPSLDRQLAAITGQLAVLAGKLSFRLHNLGLAEDYYSLAERIAMEIGDTSLASLAWASRSTIFSNIDYGSRDRPRSRTALALLDAAATSISPTASPQLRAWIRWHRAEELAALDEPYAAARDLDEGLRMVASASAPDEGLFANITVDSLAGYRGCCAVSLGNWIEAIPVLEEAESGGPPQPWQGSAVRIDLAAAYARQSEVDHACALLAEALDAARRTRMRAIVRRIRSVYLHTLVSQADLPEARSLDEQLSLVELSS
jgi:hypothetical protein